MFSWICNWYNLFWVAGIWYTLFDFVGFWWNTCFSVICTVKVSHVHHTWRLIWTVGKKKLKSQNCPCLCFLQLLIPSSSPHQKNRYPLLVFPSIIKRFPLFTSSFDRNPNLASPNPIYLPFFPFESSPLTAQTKRNTQIEESSWQPTDHRLHFCRTHAILFVVSIS